MYIFIEPTLTEALIRAKDRGVSMRVILDALQAGSATSQADALKKAGVTVKLMRGIKGNGNQRLSKPSADFASRATTIGTSGAIMARDWVSTKAGTPRNVALMILVYTLTKHPPDDIQQSD